MVKGRLFFYSLLLRKGPDNIISKLFSLGSGGRGMEGTEGTGACGINCYICKLFTDGRCSPCGSGLSEQAARKLASQLRLMGGVCPILNCAVERKVEFCLRDCDSFPLCSFQIRSLPLQRRFFTDADTKKGRTCLGKSPQIPDPLKAFIEFSPFS